MKTICVYLGSNAGHQATFSDAIRQLGKDIAELNLILIYGGSSLGLMGELATAVKSHGGKVIGIITEQLLEKEKPVMALLDELQILESMQARKQAMQTKADLFLVLPGGLGTLEEAFETWNAIKIGIFDKPIGFLNLNGYFDGLFSFISTCEHHGFITKTHQEIPLIHEDPSILLKKIMMKSHHG